VYSAELEKDLSAYKKMFVR